MQRNKCRHPILYDGRLSKDSERAAGNTHRYVSWARRKSINYGGVALDIQLLAVQSRTIVIPTSMQVNVM